MTLFAIGKGEMGLVQEERKERNLTKTPMSRRNVKRKASREETRKFKQWALGSRKAPCGKKKWSRKKRLTLNGADRKSPLEKERNGWG